MELILSDGQVSLVEESDYIFFHQWAWHPNRGRHTTYVIGTECSKQQHKSLMLHREIIKLQGYNIEGLLVDHKDRNGLNNLHNNLRICNSSQNRANSQKRSDNTSGYIGVSLEKNCWKWRARITYNHTRHSLGLFDNEKDAARAYNERAIYYWGNFASINEGL